MRGLNWVTEFLMSYSLFAAELRSHFSRFPPSPFSLHHRPPIYLLIRVSSIINSAFLKLIRVVLCKWCCCCFFLFSHTRTPLAQLLCLGSALCCDFPAAGQAVGEFEFGLCTLYIHGWSVLGIWPTPGRALLWFATQAIPGCCVSAFRCVGVGRQWFYLFSTIKPL